MKIAILGPVHPYRGGIAHYTTSLYRVLLDEGHDVALFNFTRQYPKLLFPGTSQEDDTPSAFRAPSKRVIDSLNPLSWLRTLRAVQRFGPDVAVLMWWHPFFAPSLGSIARGLRRLAGCRVVFLCHNVLPHEGSVFDRTLARYAYGAADRFIVQASEERARLRELVGYEPAVEVAPHPVYEVFAEGREAEADTGAARRTLGVPEDARVLLFFGYVRHYKGLDVLFEALARTEPAIHLVIAGECYEDATELRRQMNERGLAERVHWFDRYVPNEEVPTFFAAADVVVLPYRNATQSGIVQLAYAFGVPVIVSAVGGIPEVVDAERTGLLVPPEDPDALAAAIARFYEEGLRDGLVAGVAEKRTSTGWDRVVKAITG